MARVIEEVSRHVKDLAKDILRYAPILVVQGARQVGKSTLLRQAFSGDNTIFVTLDDVDVRAFAEADPLSFVEQAPGKLLVIDELQRVPELMLALKASVDRDRRPGRFAVTGSTNLLRTPGVSDSLAGRAETLSVDPLSQGEIIERSTPEDWVSWVLDGCNSSFKVQEPEKVDDVRECVLAGGYPEPLKRPHVQAQRWFRGYLDRLITHDARELSGTSKYPLHLEQMLRLFAAQGQAELVKAKMARGLGISETAMTDYIELAKTMYLVEELPSWGIGFSGRVVRRPKMSLVDTGLASYLSGLTPQKARQVGGFELFGAMLESFVVGELRKQQTWSDEEFRLFHYRQRDEEVDIVIEFADGRVLLVEVKSAQHVDARAWKNLDSMMEKLGDRVVASVVLYLGDKHMAMSRAHGKVIVTPVSSLWMHP